MVPIKTPVIVLALLTVWLMAMNTSEATHRCCRSYMKTKLPFRVIEGFSIQTVTEFCPIDAIIFHVKRGQTCANPTLSWVMEYVNRLGTKAQMIHLNKSKAQQ